MILRTNLRRGCANGEGPLATTCRAITNAHDIELILMGPTIDAPREFLLRAIAGRGLSQTPCLDRNKCAASGVNRLRHHGKCGNEAQGGAGNQNFGS